MGHTDQQLQAQETVAEVPGASSALVAWEALLEALGSQGNRVACLGVASQDGKAAFLGVGSQDVGQASCQGRRKNLGDLLPVGKESARSDGSQGEERGVGSLGVEVVLSVEVRVCLLALL